MLFYQGSLAHNPSNQLRPSFFSSENLNIDLRGFMNLAILLLFSNNLTLILENVRKYGFIIKDNFVTLGLNLMHQGFYLGQVGLVLLYMAGYYLVAYNTRTKKAKGWRRTTEAILVIVLLAFPIILHALMDISFCRDRLTQ